MQTRNFKQRSWRTVLKGKIFFSILKSNFIDLILIKEVNIPGAQLVWLVIESIGDVNVKKAHSYIQCTSSEVCVYCSKW